MKQLLIILTLLALPLSVQSIQKKAALDLLDTYISNLPYLTNEE